MVSAPATRLAWLRGNPAHRSVLAGWTYPEDEDLDAMFFAREMPPLFEEAVAATGHILDELTDGRWIVQRHRSDDGPGRIVAKRRDPSQ